MKFLKESLMNEEVKNNPHYNLSMDKDENGMVVFNLKDKNDNQIAIINKYGSAIIAICSGKYTDKMIKSLSGMANTYKITVNGNKI